MGLHQFDLSKPWSEAEMSILLDALETHSASKQHLLDRIHELTGRSEKSIERKLIKIGHLVRIKGGETVTRRSAFGYVR